MDSENVLWFVAGAIGGVLFCAWIDSEEEEEEVKKEINGKEKSEEPAPELA